MKVIWSLFWATIASFIVALFYLQVVRESVPGLFLLSFGIYSLLGTALLVLTIRKKDIEKILKRFLLLTGASSAGLIVSVFLHNAIYALLVHFLGGGVDDEPVFFIIAVIICPLGFLVGVIGSLVRSWKLKRKP